MRFSRSHQRDDGASAVVCGKQIHRLQQFAVVGKMRDQIAENPAAIPARCASLWKIKQLVHESATVGVSEVEVEKGQSASRQVVAQSKTVEMPFTPQFGHLQQRNVACSTQQHASERARMSNKQPRRLTEREQTAASESSPCGSARVRSTFIRMASSMTRVVKYGARFFSVCACTHNKQL